MTAIKNRLKTVQKKMNITNSEFCACFPQHFEIYIQDLGEDAEHNEPVLTSKPLSEICPVCRKQTEKKSITVQLVDGTTKDRFPDEWKANKNKNGDLIK
jgi:hypothetical protein